LAASPAHSAQLLKLYLRHLANAGKAKGTLQRYGEALRLCLGYFDHRDPGEITTDLLDEFYEDLRVRRCASTVNMIKSAVRGFYQYLLQTEKVSKDPTRLIKNEKVVRKSPGIFSEDQLQGLLDAIAAEIGGHGPAVPEGEAVLRSPERGGAGPKPGPMRDWMMLTLAYYTGLRVSELVHVNIEDVEGKKTLEVIGKGTKLATIPLNEKTQLALRKYLPWRKALPAADRKALFLNRFGARITTRAVEMNLKKWLKKAKIEADFSPHSLRHTFGTNILRATKNIRVAQRLLRHANVTTTQIYTHVDDGETRSAVESLE
jgi:integrase/recombinase XerC